MTRSSHMFRPASASWTTHMGASAEAWRLHSSLTRGSGKAASPVKLYERLRRLEQAVYTSSERTPRMLPPSVTSLTTRPLLLRRWVAWTYRPASWTMSKLRRALLALGLAACVLYLSARALTKS